MPGPARNAVLHLALPCAWSCRPLAQPSAAAEREDGAVHAGDFRRRRGCSGSPDHAWRAWRVAAPRIAAAIGFRALRGSGQEAGWSTSFRDWAAQRRTTRAKSSRRPWRTRVRNPADGPVRAAAVHGRLSRVPWRKRRAADCPRADTVPMLATWTRSGYDQAARRARARILHLRSGPAG